MLNVSLQVYISYIDPTGYQTCKKNMFYQHFLLAALHLPSPSPPAWAPGMTLQGTQGVVWKS